jgi:outer membrane receptor for ferrienterochelin and colicins
VEGKVATSGSPPQALPGASVYWLGTTTGTVSDANGYFRLLKTGNVRQLVVRFLGYLPDTLLVNGKSLLVVTLQPEAATLQQVEVNVERPATYTDYLDPHNTRIMTEKELFKAACCNLSESFETNPSVDVAFTDALTGTKQIQLLGLAGTYTQLNLENMPGIRGLASNYGLSYLPGTWLESIQVTKGAGSVVNGYESMAGQINVELKKPQTAESLYANAYANGMGRTEANLNLSHSLNKHWGSMLLMHVNYLGNGMDRNGDGFVEMPTGKQFNVLNRWSYQHAKGWIAQFGLRTLYDERLGGHADMHMGNLNIPHYSTRMETRRTEGFGKLGYVFPGKPYQSVGLQVTALYHDMGAAFGNTRYQGRERSFYSNLVFQSVIADTRHKFKTGFSLLWDDYQESYTPPFASEPLLDTLTDHSAHHGMPVASADHFRLLRTEQVPGTFLEYAYEPGEKFGLVAGLRLDAHNLFGVFVTPRLHLRYAPFPSTTLRLSAGRGQRVANILIENAAALTSSRSIRIGSQGLLPAKTSYSLDPEKSWNYGLSLAQEFDLLGRFAVLNVEFFRTDFQNQVVADLDSSPTQIRFDNLRGRSFSNSFQVELVYKPVRRMELRTAYRWLDVKTTYGGRLLERPLLSRHRIFLNMGYQWRKWNIDYTLSWNGPKRIPSTASNPEAYQLPERSPGSWTVNAQLTRNLGAMDAYIGVENLTGFRQLRPINAWQDPYGPYFDPSLSWGPLIGAMPYLGLRFKVK